MDYNKLFNKLSIPIAVFSDGDFKVLFKNKAFTDLFDNEMSTDFDANMLFNILNIDISALKYSLSSGKSYSHTSYIDGIPLYYTEVAQFVSKNDGYMACTVYFLPSFADGAIFSDFLTGLQNRAGFEYFADKLRLRNSNSDFLFMIIDIDSFKHINDRYGHAFGDEILIAFSAKLKALQTENSVCGRFGGDEFIVMHKIEHGNSIKDIIEEYSRQLNGEYKDINVFCSIGAAVGGVSSKIKDMLLKADFELLRNKASFNCNNLQEFV